MTNDKELQTETIKEKSEEEAALLLANTEIIPTKGVIYEQYVSILKQVLPHIGKDENKIIYAQVMLALKLEGLIGKKLSDDDSKMIGIIKDAIMASEDRKESALKVAERVISQS